MDFYQTETQTAPVLDVSLDHRHVGDPARSHDNKFQVMNLKDLLILSAERTPDGLAIKGPDGSMTYGELDRLANRIARALA
ncbi:MAG: hypothetical protein V3S14_11660, partial [Anaerolineae bacterium]